MDGLLSVMEEVAELKKQLEVPEFLFALTFDF
jgi:hypothetical protein